MVFSLVFREKREELLLLFDQIVPLSQLSEFELQILRLEPLLPLSVFILYFVFNSLLFCFDLLLEFLLDL